jgi:hypothetical protein
MPEYQTCCIHHLEDHGWCALKMEGMALIIKWTSDHSNELNLDMPRLSECDYG